MTGHGVRVDPRATTRAHILFDARAPAQLDRGIGDLQPITQVMCVQELGMLGLQAKDVASASSTRKGREGALDEARRRLRLLRAERVPEPAHRIGIAEPVQRLEQSACTRPVTAELAIL